MTVKRLPTHTEYSGGGYQVSVGLDGAIVVQPGDSLSKYSKAIYGDFDHIDRFVRIVGGKVTAIANVNLIKVGETLYHTDEQLPTSSNAPFDLSKLDAFLKKQGIRVRADWYALNPDTSRGLELETEFDTIVVHHSGPKALSSPFWIQASHFRRGFADIGYHFVIQESGRVSEGRRLVYKGSHVKNQNGGKIGIVLAGCFEPGKKWPFGGADTPTAQQLDALKRLAIALVQFIPSLHRLGGHLDYMQTDCPGQNLYPSLNGVRAATGLMKPPQHKTSRP